MKIKFLRVWVTEPNGGPPVRYQEAFLGSSIVTALDAINPRRLLKLEFIEVCFQLFDKAEDERMEKGSRPSAHEKTEIEQIFMRTKLTVRYDYHIRGL